MSERETIVGVFNDRPQAQQAVAELHRAGFTDDQIGVVSHEEDHGETNVEGDKIAGGAAAGAAAGAGVGALWGFGIAAGLLPAIGPVIAGGTLMAILASAATGAAAAGIVGALVGMGIPKEEAEYYEQEFGAGRTVVTVRTAGRGLEAREILDRFGAYDYATRGNVTTTSASATTHHSIDVPVTRDDVSARREAGSPLFDEDACDVPPTGTSTPRRTKLD